MKQALPITNKRSPVLIFSASVALLVSLFMTSGCSPDEPKSVSPNNIPFTLSIEKGNVLSQIVDYDYRIFVNQMEMRSATFHDKDTIDYKYIARSISSSDTIYISVIAYKRRDGIRIAVGEGRIAVLSSDDNRPRLPLKGYGFVAIVGNVDLSGMLDKDDATIGDISAAMSVDVDTTGRGSTFEDFVQISYLFGPFNVHANNPKPTLQEYIQRYGSKDQVPRDTVVYSSGSELTSALTRKQVFPAQGATIRLRYHLLLKSKATGIYFPSEAGESLDLTKYEGDTIRYNARFQ